MVKDLLRILGAAILVFTCCTGGAPAQTGEPMVSIVPRAGAEGSTHPMDVPDVHIRVDASVVLIPVQAKSPMGDAITDLMASNFRLTKTP